MTEFVITKYPARGHRTGGSDYGTSHAPQTEQKNAVDESRSKFIDEVLARLNSQKIVVEEIERRKAA